MSPSDVVAVVGCGSAKRDVACEARDLYTSTYFALKREYAETFADRMVILSAEHALVPADQELEPYNTTISDDDFDRDAFIESVDQTMTAPEVALNEADEVIVLAGQDYSALFRAACDRRDARCVDDECPTIDGSVSFPFEEAKDLDGIGDQMGWMRQAVDDGVRVP